MDKTRTTLAMVGLLMGAVDPWENREFAPTPKAAPAGKRNEKKAAQKRARKARKAQR